MFQYVNGGKIKFLVSNANPTLTKTLIINITLSHQQWRSQGGGHGGHGPPPKLLVNFFFLQQIDVVTLFDSEIYKNVAEVR